MFIRVNGAIAAHRSQRNDTGAAHLLRAPARRLASLTTAALLASAALTPAMAVQLKNPANPFDIGTLGGPGSAPAAVSADGTTVVGWSGNLPFRYVWSTNTMVALPALSGGGPSAASGVSADGSVVVGYSISSTFQPGITVQHAFRWTQAGTVDIDQVDNRTSYAKAVNSDGTVIVGLFTQNGIQQAFRWTQLGGMAGLGQLNGGSNSIATGVSGDGTIVVGSATDGQANAARAFRWTQASGMVSLGAPDPFGSSHALAISSDGLVIVGYATANGGVDYPVRWTASTDFVSLGALSANTSAQANAVNADGSVIVGTFRNVVNFALSSFRWTQATGMITVDKWLSDNGVTVGNNVTATATGVSADGSVVVGTLQNGHAYVARGPVPVQASSGGTTNTTTTTAGLMDVTNYQASLAASPRLAPQVQNADLVMNGAHSSPLFMLLDAGQSSASFTGDGGYANGGSYRGGLGAGEFGFGRGIEGGWTVRIAGGGQYARFDTPNAGNSVFSSGYIAPDVSYEVGGVVATLSGYFNWGKADVRRGYLNGAANDSSFGSTATQTYGVRARVDWQDAFKLASTGVSPFVSYTYLNAQMNGYTETGGSFPVQFNGSREISNAVRIGADATTPLNEQFALVTRLEYGHRFEKAGAGVSGQILGLSAFSIDGASVQQDWLRGGLGVSYKLGNGDGLVMVNTSNQTGKNTTWVSASYRVKF